MRQNASFALQGGLNLRGQNVAQINPGELADCQNIHVHKDGGYVVSGGFELCKGTGRASSSSNFADYVTALNLIKPVGTSSAPASHTGPVLGGFILSEEVYTFRRKMVAGAASDYISLIKATGASPFWSVVGDVLGNDSQAPTKRARTTKYTFTTTEEVFIVNGATKCLRFNGATLTEISATGVAADHPEQVAVYANHLFLGYAGGSLLFSGPGDPTVFTVVGGGGEIRVGGDITNLVVHNNALIITTLQSIHYLTGSGESDFVLKTITTQNGALPDCAGVIGSDVVFVDKSGSIFMLSATNNFGDFAIGSVTAAVSTYDNVLKSAVCISTNNETWMTRIFSPGAALSMTTEAGKIMGFGAQEIPSAFGNVFCVFNGYQNGEVHTYLGDAGGYLWELDKCPYMHTSKITFMLRTVPFHYGSPDRRKRFHQINLEANHNGGATIYAQMAFDYSGFDGANTPMTIPSGVRGVIDADEIDTFQLDAFPGFSKHKANISGVGVYAEITLSADGNVFNDIPASYTAKVGGARFSTIDVQYSTRGQER